MPTKPSCSIRAALGCDLEVPCSGTLLINFSISFSELLGALLKATTASLGSTLKV